MRSNWLNALLILPLLSSCAANTEAHHVICFGYCNTDYIRCYGFCLAEELFHTTPGPDSDEAATPKMK